ncbi:predicted protein [Chaetoceros tenuissimus]|uniref:Uncharacterized protein n=1 Tax=Chaetoceros tenuissimus TaxID=426638 RepID=A0AAD3H3N7_9STRA|nr:predicted protein [Chaetoceros tenuissimus]
MRLSFNWFILTVSAVVSGENSYDNFTDTHMEKENNMHPESSVTVRSKSTIARRQEDRALRRNKAAVNLNIQAMVAENIAVDDSKVWKGVGYGFEMKKKSRSKGKGSSSSKKSSRCEEGYSKGKGSSDYYRSGKGSQDYYGKGKGSSDYYSGKGKGSMKTSNPSSYMDTNAPSNAPTRSSAPSCSPSPSIDYIPSFSPSPSISPTSSPSIDPFDLQNCDTYKLEWLFDLSNSCIDSSLSSCQCYDARERIDKGQITCGVDMCPEDCEVCKVCLYEIECPRAPTQSPSSSPTVAGSSEPSSKPSNALSSVPSTSPSHSPTHVTTSPHPTSLPSSEPTPVFDLDNCDTYSSSWRYELITEGKCTSAELLVKDGVITCDSVCPENCAMCQFCLNTALSCREPSAAPSQSPSTSFPTSSPSLSPSNRPSSKPVTSFDIADCDSYSSAWRFELIVDGKCTSAEKLVDSGAITCESICPEGCSICSFCLNTVLQCPDRQTTSPSISPSVTSNPTVRASQSPTSLSPISSPSLSPSNRPSSKPVTSFDIADCDSYSSAWRFELIVDGKCTSTEKLVDSGAITCESICPEGCSICSFCLNTVLQCPDRQTTSPSISPSVTSNPTVRASQSPTSLSPISSPSLSPSNRPSSKPATSFDIADCDSYSSAWRFELIVEGKCTSAAKLFETGAITCESTCPKGCTMCTFCLEAVRSCKETDIPSVAPSPSPSLIGSSEPSALESFEPTSQPTFNPTITFDLQNCSSYEDRWLLEVIASGLCTDAINRNARGEIGCKSSECPENCAVCNVCLDQIQCPATSSPSTLPSTPPTSIPSKEFSDGPSATPSIFPTLSPTEVPTFKPSKVVSSLPSSKPVEEPTFNLDDCSSYSSQWRFELIVEGKCESAELLANENQITCDSVCPEGCAMCHFCLRSVLTCPNPSPTVTPSASPSIVTNPPSDPLFDLQKCDTYRIEWTQNINDSCLDIPGPNDKTCQCPDARHRIDSGEISCGSDVCPEDCEICKVCLDLVECPRVRSSSPSISPSSTPSSSPTLQPSNSLTNAPSLSPSTSIPTKSSPTAKPSNLPSDVFDLSDCSSYARTWLFDLSNTCGEDVTHHNFNDSCRAIDAEKKIENGFITCGLDRCPSSCLICEYALYDVLGCRPARTRNLRKRRQRKVEGKRI